VVFNGGCGKRVLLCTIDYGTGLKSGDSATSISKWNRCKVGSEQTASAYFHPWQCQHHVDLCPGDTTRRTTLSRDIVDGACICIGSGVPRTRSIRVLFAFVQIVHLGGRKVRRDCAIELYRADTWLSWDSRIDLHDISSKQHSALRDLRPRGARGPTWDETLTEPDRRRSGLC
jgi:hypothetical protein